MLRGGKQYPLLNRELHLTLARPSGRRRSIALLAEMLTLSALHVREDTRRIDGRREQSHHEHHALVEAARARDAEGAAEIVRQHCQPILSLLKRDLAAAAQAAGAPGALTCALTQAPRPGECAGCHGHPAPVRDIRPCPS